MKKVFIILRVDKENGNSVIWKVYESKEKAEEACEALTNEKYIFRYEDWLVK